ncbi:hypothetical protein [Nocardioides daeguensis]|uniref:Carotenoid biosynthesis protein n=1 Tax=Nocardioides daeguensis TaxID=908359 RepID=A0ABP6V4N7_9ACTN|nr:hypothetical protein [Nocardioides daeguensis]MBV6729693.1 hypothetical protein [Nocardioides daeguensis]MCR1774702.1 hypothetical protein [Nocardioides daeguensis]
MTPLLTTLLSPLVPTDAAREALTMLRDPSNLHWYVVTFFGIVMYVYANEVERKRYDVVAAGLAFFLMDVFNELVNSAWFHLSDRAPLWTVTGDTAYLILIGWSIEIVFLFLISGIEFVKFLPADKGMRILGIPNRWFFVTWWSCVCVFVEVLLHRAGIFHWSWWYWGEPFLLPIVVLGYGTFFWIAATVFDMDSHRKRFTVVGAMAAVDLVLAVGFGLAGWL